MTAQPDSSIPDPAQPSASEEPISLESQLTDAIKGTYAGFDARFCQLDYSWPAEDLKVSGSFLYPAFGGDGGPTVTQLVEWLYFRTIAFCIPQSERDRAEAEYQRTRDDRFHIEIQDKARHLFVRAKASQKTTGEPGELLLFTLLEAVLKAPQIASKMYLKTSANVPVHGSDSIHAMVGRRPTNLTVVWGESKTYKGLNAALERICVSIGSFLAPGATGEPPPRSRDIDIIKDHLNITDPILREALLQYFDPYSERSNELEEMFACLVAFESLSYSGLTNTAVEERDVAFRRLLERDVTAACDSFARIIRRENLHQHRFHLFLVPVPSINAFRREFFLKLGVHQSDIGLTEDES